MSGCFAIPSPKACTMQAMRWDCCYDGAEALERLLIEQYDLIVLDLHLPGMDGMEVLERLRQTDAETKVLILSARSQVADKVAGLDAGANDYLEKPFICRSWRQGCAA